MVVESLKKHVYAFGLLAIMVAVTAYKFRFLSLPYFWDEAWPYAVGVRTLYEHGLSLMPGAVPPFVARGHPLMFHFLAAAWMKVFGTGLFSGHSFALTVSLLTLLTMYKFCSDFFSQRIGFIACLLFSTQAIFIAQSAFLMPEMLMALWTMLCLYTYFKGYKFLFVICAACMMLTKEPGIVLVGALMFSELVQFACSKDRSTKVLLRKVLWLGTPVVIAALYFICQKVKYGWFLYPFYMDYLPSALKAFSQNLPSGLAYFFVYYGRNGLSFFVIISFVIALFSKRIYFTVREKKTLMVLACFVVMYLLFSLLNYYIPRYLLCAFPPFMIIAATLMDRALGKVKIVYPLIITGLVITHLFYYFNGRKDGDVDYSPSVKTDWDMVRFCEKENLFANHIFTTSVLRSDLNEPWAGYLSGRRFSNVEWEFTDKTEYCIFSADEYEDELFDKIKREHNLQLIQRFEQKYAWCELYKVVR